MYYYRLSSSSLKSIHSRHNITPRSPFICLLDVVMCPCDPCFSSYLLKGLAFHRHPQYILFIQSSHPIFPRCVCSSLLPRCFVHPVTCFFFFFPERQRLIPLRYTVYNLSERKASRRDYSCPMTCPRGTLRVTDEHNCSSAPFTQNNGPFGFFISITKPA